LTNCPPSTALLTLRTRSKTPPQPLGRLEALLGRRWDGLKRKKPLPSLVWDGGTAGTGGGGMPSPHRRTGHQTALFLDTDSYYDSHSHTFETSVFSAIPNLFEPFRTPNIFFSWVEISILVTSSSNLQIVSSFRNANFW